MIEKNITQEDLGNMINVNRQMISRWISGGRNPSLGSLKKFSAVLDVPVNYFLEPDEQKNDGIKTTKNKNNGNENELNILMRLIENQNKVIEKNNKFLEEKMKRFETELEMIKTKIN